MLQWTAGKIFVTGSTQRFVCKYPGCAREYASRDAVRKHCRIRHQAWLKTLVRTSAREVEVIPEQPAADSPLGGLLTPLLTPTLGPASPPTAMMGNLDLFSVPPMELNPSTPPEEEAPGFDALLNRRVGFGFDDSAEEELVPGPEALPESVKDHSRGLWQQIERGAVDEVQSCLGRGKHASEAEKERKEQVRMSKHKLLRHIFEHRYYEMCSVVVVGMVVP